MKRLKELLDNCDSLMSRSDYDSALIISTEIASLYPEKIGGHSRMARCFLALEKPREALGIAYKALVKFPTEAILISIIADSYLLMGNPEKALAFSRFFVCLHPSKWQGYAKVARILIKLNELSEAEAIISQGLDKHPNETRLLALAVEIYRLLGSRSKSNIYADRLMSIDPRNWNSYKHSIVNCIILKQESQAQSLLSLYQERASASEMPELAIRLETFLARDNLRNLAHDVFSLTRKRLHAYFREETTTAKLIVAELKKYSDLVIVSNNSTLSLSENDIEVICSMKNPLFIYLNVGNPIFRGKYQQVLAKRGCEMLYARTNQCADSSGKLIFEPYDAQKFALCFLVHEGSPPWLSSFSNINRVEPIIPYHIHGLIKEAYPVGFSDRGELSKRQVPSMGWIALTFIDAISSYRGLSQEMMDDNSLFVNQQLWLSGLSISPSYMFELVPGNIHNFVFEHTALEEYHLRTGVRRLGHTNDEAVELKRTHLTKGIAPWREESSIKK